MPRFEPAINQFIAPEDLQAISAAPLKPARTQTRKKSNSISALERIGVFTEATQKVKRRLRSVIAGAVGASTNRPKRKSRDIMHVDYVWNGWFEPSSAPIDPTPEPVARPRHNDLPNFAPTINRYSVNMDAKSISDVSMDLGETDDEGASTPRANSPEPGTPTVSAKEVKKVSVETEDEDNEEDHDEHDYEGHEDNEEDEGEEEVSTPSKSKKNEILSKQEDDQISIFSPMDEDPKSACTPKVTSPVALSPHESPRKSSRSYVPTLYDSSDERTPPLVKRTSSTDSSPPKTPKLTLITNFIRTPVRENSHFLVGMVDVITVSPVCLGLDVQPELHKAKAFDQMEVILPSAISQDGDAPTYASFDRQTADARQPEVMQVKEVSQKPALIPAAKLVEKKPGHKSRRGSRASETETIACSPRRASIIAAKKNSKGSLNGAERNQDVVSPTTMLRAKIDSLPFERDDSIPAWGLWKLQTTGPFFHENSSEYSVLTVHQASQ